MSSNPALSMTSYRQSKPPANTKQYPTPPLHNKRYGQLRYSGVHRARPREPPASVIVSGLSSHIVQLQLVKSYARDILARLGVQPENRRWHHGQ